LVVFAQNPFARSFENLKVTRVAGMVQPQ
jgi:hypothetical protein